MGLPMGLPLAIKICEDFELTKASPYSCQCGECDHVKYDKKGYFCEQYKRYVNRHNGCHTDFERHQIESKNW